LSADDRKAFFDEAVQKLGIVFPIIEKDFWVVWTLERLFALNDLKQDYDLMETMFYGENPRPEWDVILKAIAEFERDFNRC